MKPAPFDYYPAGTTTEALDLLSEHGFDAKLLAGGQSMIPAMNFRLSAPPVIIDLNPVEDLFYIKDVNGQGVHIGAMTRQRTVEKNDLIARKAPLLTETLPFIAHPQIRNRGTIGGSIVHADPAAELPAIMIALDAKFSLLSKNGSRLLPANEFFTGMFTTALDESEMLDGIIIPALPSFSGWAFEEVARRHGDYAMVGVAAFLELDKVSQVTTARIVFLSVGDGPVEARLACDSLVGNKLTRKQIEEAADLASAKDIDPGNDIHASAEYRRHLARVLTKRVLHRAAERAQKSVNG